MATLCRQCALGLLFMVLIASASATAQSGVVVADRENFRIAPGGNILAEVIAGTELALGATQGNWREATLEGWIWALSVREERRGDLDLFLLPPEGESLRARPNGGMIARLRPGMRLQSVETEGDWIRVRRTGWIWGPSLVVSDPAPAPTAGPIAAPRPAGEGAVITAGPRGLAVLARPAGDTVARIQQGVGAEILDRDGDWVRVRVEGWAFAGQTDGPGAASAVLRDVSRMQLTQNPARYTGRLVEWPVQFIAVQQAERFRSDFREGEPFLLARGPGDDAGFIYVAIPPERIDEVRRLAPLARIQILARVRTGRSLLTDAPVLELLQITAAEDETS